ncbi:hypothetical protein [Ruminococcus intestinalis]|uniref:hypothetical protein n=1 Tax=Ruminococcus intestinalis TaxID=2763066 RepID=UPI003F807E38
MADIQDKINEILSNPEALRQVQSLGEQLGLSGNAPEKPKPTENKKELSLPNELLNDDITKSLIKILPAVKSIGCEDDTTRLLNALRPFLSCEKQEKLDKAEKMLKLFKILPLLKDINIF